MRIRISTIPTKELYRNKHVLSYLLRNFGRNNQEHMDITDFCFMS